MLDEVMFRKIFEVPKFMPVLRGAIKESSIPKRKALDAVVAVVSKNKGINRKGIIDLTGFSGHCINRCVEMLIKNNELKRDEIGKAGGYKIYAYEVNLHSS